MTNSTDKKTLIKGYNTKKAILNLVRKKMQENKEIGTRRMAIA